MILAFIATYQLPGTDLARNDAFFTKLAEYAWLEWYWILGLDLGIVILATLIIFVVALAAYLSAKGQSRTSFLGLVAAGFGGCFSAFAALQLASLLVAWTIFHPVLAWLADLAANSYSAEVGITKSLAFWVPIIVMALFGAL